MSKRTTKQRRAAKRRRVWVEGWLDTGVGACPRTASGWHKYGPDGVKCYPCGARRTEVRVWACGPLGVHTPQHLRAWALVQSLTP